MSSEGGGSVVRLLLNHWQPLLHSQRLILHHPIDNFYQFYLWRMQILSRDIYDPAVNLSLHYRLHKIRTSITEQFTSFLAAFFPSF